MFNNGGKYRRITIEANHPFGVILAV